ncbi:MAG: hypothetical protein IPG92_11680 [Flavobacteriales bacterium]|nr:hypothetical protein [Flavobacteriales bacterium]
MNNRSHSDRFEAETPENGPSSLKQRLSKHFKACTKAATLVAGLVAAGESSAAIVNWVPGTPIAIPATTAGVYINVQTETSGVSPAGVPGWDLNPWNASSLSWFNPTLPGGNVYMQAPGGTGVGNLPYGTLIDGTATWANGSVAGATPAWNLNSSKNYVGFQFQNENTAWSIMAGHKFNFGADLVTNRSILQISWEDVAGVGIYNTRLLYN